MGFHDSVRWGLLLSPQYLGNCNSLCNFSKGSQLVRGELGFRFRISESTSITLLRVGDETYPFKCTDHNYTTRCVLKNCSVKFSRSVESNSLRPHESQHARPPCPSLTPGAYSNSCTSSRWCHLAISFSVVPFSSCPQSLSAKGLFQWVNSSHQVFSNG